MDLSKIDYLTQEDIYKKVNPEELMNKINRFKLLNIDTMSDKDLSDEIGNILSQKDLSGMIITTLICTYSIFPKDTRFYRVRKLRNLDIPNDNLSKLSDFWNPPKRFITNYGRLNKPNESLLYTARNPYIAIKETNITKNDYFALNIYKANRDVKVSWIGADINYKFHNIFNKSAINIHEIYKDFLLDEFTKEVVNGQEYLYRVSEHIAKNYFLCAFQDGWKYSSVKDRSEHNVCFKAESISEALTLVGTMIAICSDDTSMEVKYIAQGFDRNRRAIIHEYSPDFLKKYFPEFSYSES